jgi:translation initiation factor 4G
MTVKYTKESIYNLKSHLVDNPFLTDIQIVRTVVPGIYNSSRSSTHRKKYPQRRQRYSDTFEWSRAPKPKPLVTSKNAWKRLDPNIILEKNVVIIKKLKGILNKLTCINYDKLYKEIMDIEFPNDESISNMVNEIFKKAIEQKYFGELYAKLCKDIIKTNKIENFKRILMLLCQKEYEKINIDIYAEINKQKEDVKNDTSLSTQEKCYKTEDLDCERNKIKNKMIGNINFIGELFKIGIIPDVLIHECMTQLLKNTTENNIEYTCKLMESVGHVIVKNKPLCLNNYFKILTTLSLDKSISMRYRFMIKDTIDLKKNNWICRKSKINKKMSMVVPQKSKLVKFTF